MEKAEQELLQRHLPINPTLKKLYAQHLRLEKEVERFGRYAAYSASARLRTQELKKAKLQGKESLLQMLATIREETEN